MKSNFSVATKPQIKISGVLSLDLNLKLLGTEFTWNRKIINRPSINKKLSWGIPETLPDLPDSLMNLRFQVNSMKIDLISLSIERINIWYNSIFYWMLLIIVVKFWKTLPLRYCNTCTLSRRYFQSCKPDLFLCISFYWSVSTKVYLCNAGMYTLKKLIWYINN